MPHAKGHAIVFAGGAEQAGYTFTIAGYAGEVLRMAAELLADVCFAYVFEAYQVKGVHGKPLPEEAVVCALPKNNTFCAFEPAIVRGIGNGDGYAECNGFRNIVFSCIQRGFHTLSVVVLHSPQYCIVAMNIEEDQDDTRYGKRTSHRGAIITD